MDLELRGKRAVITGGSVGIGLAVAHALAAEGVDVAIVARELGIPAVVGAKGAVAAAQGARAAEVDGGTGEIRFLAGEAPTVSARRPTRRLKVEEAPLRLMANVGSAQAARPRLLLVESVAGT